MADEKPVLFNDKPVIQVDAAVLADLKRRAAARPDGKFRLCLHHAASDTLHDMIIVHGPGTYVRPHKHPDHPKSIHMLEGRMIVGLYDDGGRRRERFVLEAAGGAGPFLCRIDPGVWHTELPLSDPCVFIETMLGPFDPQTSNVFAGWSPPPEDEAGVRAFIESLQQST